MIWQSEVWYCTTRLGRVHYCKLAVVTADQKAIAQIILRVLHLNTNAHNTHSVTREHNTRRDTSTKQSIKSSSVTHCNWTASQVEMDLEMDTSQMSTKMLMPAMVRCKNSIWLLASVRQSCVGDKRPIPRLGDSLARNRSGICNC